ncbi:HlyC/CorC family transporter [Aeromonas enteropelogenes]|uniref:Polyamine export protein n=2 Tax=Aeromonas TaxID=642 RepID=A0ABU9J8Q9_AEREN|nr:hemolysin family protein [Aeromonas enteropelogenes]MBL0456111.1 HlyC/CorC family transporter [Aeromonas enteropelogenes]MBL0520003.1 HlyC/CorC family transporter [Aeromonas enteropelogenes]MCZ0750786.1 hemolysin family protein [Aeromonas enteropelogenes]RQM62850.1 HlyC/CorC family transporter [Aeromonas enteropelogenes]UBH29436.1 hemolysin family protein [Aeromonas enteropelogenes]
MSFADSLFFLMLLVAGSVFFSLSEISLAASRKIKLQVMADEGNRQAEKVLALQAQPGNFFTVVQIGLNTVAILGGILGESSLNPAIKEIVSGFYQGPWLGEISSGISFVFVTGMFILLADLMPKRLAMTMPERIAVVVVRPMMFFVAVLLPLVWVFNGLANTLFRMLRISTVRRDEITSDDIYAVMDAGAEAGVIQREEHQLIENVFELQSLCVTSAMTARESLIYFTLQEGEESIKAKIAEHPHNKFLVCDHNLDSVKGFVDSKELLIRVIGGQNIDLNSGSLVQSVIILPDTLNLYEAMEYFKNHRGDFAVVMNEYALVVGIVTMNDLMSTVMGEWATHVVEEQIVQRDENSWLVDGVTPISDVMRAFDIEEFPENQNYETIAGFIMYMLRKIPKRTDSVKYAGYKFEVVDIDSYKIDQLLVTRLDPVAAAEKPAQES